MRFRVVASMLVGLVGIVGPAFVTDSAGAVPAAGSCAITNYSPHGVVLGASPVTVNFGISTTGCTRTNWTLEGSSPANFFVYDGSNQETFSPDSYLNSDAGLSSVVATADDEDYNETQRTFSYSFDLQRRVAVQGGTMNASPEPVRKGGTVTIKARLVVVDWDAYPSPKYVSFGGHTLAVQFRTPSGTYHTVKNVKTDASGWITTTATQSATGLWRVYYYGTTTYSAATINGDMVAVSG